MWDNINSNWINKHLRFIIARKFNIEESEVTKEFLSTLKELDLSEEGLDELKGLQFAINLVSLKLNRNNIKNANYIKKLTKLTNLEINQNKIQDINFLSYLKNLKTLNLESNNISYIPSLKDLNNLTLINLSNNKISDLSFINDISSNNINIIATNQVILLKPTLIYSGCNYTFTPNIFWDNNTSVLFDNIQISGSYSYLETDKRISLHYSISKVNINNITSDCIIKADFYHEVPFSKSGVLSGIVIQPLIIKSSDSNFNTDKINNSKSILYGKIILQSESSSNSDKNINNCVIINKIVSLISSNGYKIKCITNNNGEFEFENLEIGQYILLFPFISGYKYISPSLYLLNIKEEDCIELNSILIRE